MKKDGCTTKFHQKSTIRRLKIAGLSVEISQNSAAAPSDHLGWHFLHRKLAKYATISNSINDIILQTEFQKTVCKKHSKSQNADLGSRAHSCVGVLTTTDCRIGVSGFFSPKCRLPRLPNSESESFKHAPSASPLCDCKKCAYRE